MAKRSKHFNLPTNMRIRQNRGHCYYYYVFSGTPRKEISLGKDYCAALKRYAELKYEENHSPVQNTFAAIAQRYMQAELHKKAPRTQKDNQAELKQLLKFFNHPPAPIDEIKPYHIAQYRDWRKVTRSTQELALFSMIFNWAREQGLTACANPSIGIKRNRAKGRHIYINDQVFNAVYQQADQVVQNCMDLAYLTAQRPADTLKTQLHDLDENTLSIVQNKTGKKIRIALKNQDGSATTLLNVIQRIQQDKKSPSPYLLTNEKGQAITLKALSLHFKKAKQNALAALKEPTLAQTMPIFNLKIYVPKPPLNSIRHWASKLHKTYSDIQPRI